MAVSMVTGSAERPSRTRAQRLASWRSTRTIGAKPRSTLALGATDPGSVDAPSVTTGPELDELLTEGRTTEAQRQGFLACAADADALGARTDGAADLSALLTGKYCTPAEIAAHGRGAAWMEGDRRMWLGKALLIGSRWQGIKRLRAEPG